MIKEAFFESWKKFRIYLVIPDLMIVLFSLITIFYIGSFGLLNKENLLSLISSNLPDFGNFLVQNIFNIISAILLFLFLNYFIGTGVLAVKYGLLKDAVENKKFVLKLFLVYGGIYFWRVFILRLMVGILATLSLGLSLIVFFVLNSYNTKMAAFFALVLLSILIVLVKLGIMFRYACLYFKRRSPFQAIKESFKIFREKTSFLIIILLIITSVGIMMNLIADVIEILLRSIIFESIFLNLVSSIIRIISYVVFAVWADLFLFVLYSRL